MSGGELREQMSGRGRVAYGRGGDVKLWPGAAAASLFEEVVYDVAIVGAGIVGCALAYHLSQYQLRVLVIETHWDVGEGTSKANSAIIHTGFDAEPGSLESRLVTAASRQWPQLADRLKVPFERTSAVLIALNDDQQSSLPKLYDKAMANGVEDVRLLSADEVREREPYVSRQVLEGMLVPRESIADPFTASQAFAEVSLQNGVDFCFNTMISGIEAKDEAVKVLIDQGGGRLRARCIVNVAGLGSRKLAALYDADGFDINPRRGQFLVFDRNLRPRLNHILLPVPTAQTKGKLVAPTIFGNLLAGPTAEDLSPEQVTATNTTAEGLAEVFDAAGQFLPCLKSYRPIASYAGLRCNCRQGSYQIRFNDGHAGFVTVTGIRSTGLTASPTLAQLLVEGMAEQCGLALVNDPSAVTDRPVDRWPGWWRRPWQDERRLGAQRDYGRIICSCEQISRQEIVDALVHDVCPPTLDAIKRRTRAMMGRCQAFNCGTPIESILGEHSGMGLDGIGKRRPRGCSMSKLGAGTDAHAGAVGGDAGQNERIERAAVAIIGAGPAGIGAAMALERGGVRGVWLIDRAGAVGGVPARYADEPRAVPTFIDYRRCRVVSGGAYARTLAQRLDSTSIRQCLNSQVVEVDRTCRRLRIVSADGGAFVIEADAVVIATGAREQTITERGWITGARPGGVMHTMQLIDYLGRRHSPPGRQAIVLGSDLIAYSAAAKLMAAGADSVTVADLGAGPQCPWAARLYFRRWGRLAWQRVQRCVEVLGDDEVTAVRIDAGRPIAADAIIVSGCLVPNSELLMSAGFDLVPPFNQPPGSCLAPGWFVAGNTCGGFHGAHWCYRHGMQIGGEVCRYLASGSSLHR